MYGFLGGLQPYPIFIQIGLKFTEKSQSTFLAKPNRVLSCMYIL